MWILTFKFHVVVSVRIMFKSDEGESEMSNVKCWKNEKKSLPYENGRVVRKEEKTCETSTQTFLQKSPGKFRKLKETSNVSLLDTLLKTDTYLFAQVLEDLKERAKNGLDMFGKTTPSRSNQDLEETSSESSDSEDLNNFENLNDLLERFTENDLPDNEENLRDEQNLQKPKKQIVLTKMNNQIVEILPTIKASTTSSNKTATSYKTASTSLRKSSNNFNASKAKNCFQRISSLLNKERSKSPSRPTLESLIKSKIEKVHCLSSKKENLEKTIKNLEQNLGKIENLNEETIEKLMEVKSNLQLECDVFTRENKELELDVLSYQSILNDHHPTFCLFSMIKSGLRDDYEEKKKVLGLRHQVN